MFNLAPRFLTGHFYLYPIFVARRNDLFSHSKELRKHKTILLRSGPVISIPSPGAAFIFNSALSEQLSETTNAAAFERRRRRKRQDFFNRAGTEGVYTIIYYFMLLLCIGCDLRNVRRWNMKWVDKETAHKCATLQ